MQETCELHIATSGLGVRTGSRESGLAFMAKFPAMVFEELVTNRIFSREGPEFLASNDAESLKKVFSRLCSLGGSATFVTNLFWPLRAFALSAQRKPTMRG